MTAVSLQCKVKNHHPEWSNVSQHISTSRLILTVMEKTYNHVFIRWTTHNPPGLSDNDISLASICDELAENFGVLEETRGGDDKECQLRAIADKAASTAGDCCAPSK